MKTDFYVLTFVAGPIDDFTFLVPIDNMPDALVAVARVMRDNILTLSEVEITDDSTEWGDDPILETGDEVHDFLVNTIKEGLGEAPEPDALGKCTFTVNPGKEEYTVRADSYSDAWREALYVHHTDMKPRPSRIVLAA